MKTSTFAAASSFMDVYVMEASMVLLSNSVLAKHHWPNTHARALDVFPGSSTISQARRQSISIMVCQRSAAGIDA